MNRIELEQIMRERMAEIEGKYVGQYANDSSAMTRKVFEIQRTLEDLLAAYAPSEGPFAVGTELSDDRLRINLTIRPNPFAEVYVEDDREPT